MATDMISALGAGSGVDVKSLAQSLVDAEKLPREAALNTNIKDQEKRIAGYSAMSLSLQVLKEAFERLNDKNDFNAIEVSNSNTSAFTVSTTSAALPGANDVAVNQIATAQRSATLGFSSATQSLNGGNAMSLQLTVGGQRQDAVRIAGANATPEGVVAAINAAGQGVRAQLVNTGDETNPFSILLSGPMGADGAFSLETDDATGTPQAQTLTFGAATATGNIKVGGVDVAVTQGDTSAQVAAKVKAALDASSVVTGVPGRTTTDNSDGTLVFTFAASDSGDNNLSYVDSGSTGVSMGSVTSQSFVRGSSVTGLDIGSTPLQVAQDAELTINGLDVRRPSNTVTDVIPGTTLTLTGTTPAGQAASVQLSRNTETLKTNVQDLIQAYNDAVSDFAILTGPPSDDPDDIYSGSLANDSTVRQVKTQMRSMMMGTSSTSQDNIKAMRDIGLDVDRTGVMSLDEDKFDAAMTDHFAEVVGMFSANTNNQSSYGSAARGLAGDAVKSISDIISARGALLSNSETAQGRIDSYQLDLETLNTRMEALLARYTKQFALMESFVGQTNSMRESLTATFDGMMAMYTNK